MPTPKTNPKPQSSPENLRYQSHYCEENIYWLAKDRMGIKENTRAWAVWISSASKGVAIAEQKSAPSGQLVFWDYHVIYVVETDQTGGELNKRLSQDEFQKSILPWSLNAVTSLINSDKNNDLHRREFRVYDFDSRLQWGISLHDYLEASFLSPASLQKRQQSSFDPFFEPLFKWVPAHRYAAEFYSTRRHMQGADGNWLMPPPYWDAIAEDRDDKDRLSFVALRDFSKLNTFENIKEKGE